jgi:hypothetical protein
MVDPIPEYKMIVVHSPSLASNPDGRVFVQHVCVKDFVAMCVEIGAPYRFLYTLNIYPKPPKAADMVEMLKAGVPIK